ncbi:hypothetical protein VE25_04980 [Devosia geojensis]|uniref:Glycosyltransferase RgtA/B/C/D-like domain-containing protein n=1 Tax=Devosia geojensis TaxID=443610 RepID=A0A0F5FVJ9_9HYPH|nr:hypothetical protein [Devosia geojensis]KKB12911.1 hypothetical protein VE25_04980 [Devosia geojensis]
MNIVRLWPLGVLAALTAVFAVLNLSLSARHGTLAMPPIYDDVGYLLDSARRMTIERGDSVVGLVQSFLNRPPHAPLSTLLAMTGYAVFGHHVWAPYALNATVLLAYTVLMYFVARKQQATTLQSLLITFILLYPPVVHAIVTEFRPDIAAGMIFAAAIYLLIQADLTKIGGAPRIAVALVCAFAVVAKPSAFVVTVPMLGASLLISVACLGHQWRAGIRPALGLVGIALVVLVPYVIIWGRQVYEYVYQVFVTNSDVWRTGGTHFYHAIYHSFGDGGAHALGLFVPIGLATILADLVMSFKRNFDRRVAAFYIVIAVTYAGMSTAGDKSAYQGAFFYMPFLLAICVSIARLAANLTGIGRWALIAIAGIVAITAPPATTFTYANRYPNAKAMAAELVDYTERELSRCGYRAATIVGIAPYPVTPDAIALQLMLEKGADMSVQQPFLVRDLDHMISVAMSSDFILLPNSWGREISSYLPGTQFVDDVRARVMETGEWSSFRPNVEDPPEILSRTNCKRL